MTPLQAMKQALEALDNYCKFGAMLRPIDATEDLRTAIEEMERAEPVATVVVEIDCTGWFNTSRKIAHVNQRIPEGTKLYTHPAPIPEGWQLVPKERTRT